MKIEEHHVNEPLDAVLIDYLALLDPPIDRAIDHRVRMTSMIIDVRRFQTTFDGGRGLLLISPVQSNEEGRKYAADHEGVWTRSAINNDKELARSMDIIIGIFNRGRIPRTNLFDLVLSMPKDRDGGEFANSMAQMTSTGWLTALGAPTEEPMGNVVDLGDPDYGAA